MSTDFKHLVVRFTTDEGLWHRGALVPGGPQASHPVLPGRPGEVEKAGRGRPGPRPGGEDRRAQVPTTRHQVTLRPAPGPSMRALARPRG
jgi:hypothetical protein